MPINQDTKKFQESITQELNTIKDRVRNLISIGVKKDAIKKLYYEMY